MAKSIRIKMNSAGARGTLNSSAVRADLKRRGEAIAQTAGGGDDFKANFGRSGDRAVIFIRTASDAGREAEAKDRALTRALDAGR